MRDIEGTATISIKELDKLRQREQWHTDLMRRTKALVKDVETQEYDEECKKIDEMGAIEDEELEKMLQEARKTLKVIVSETVLRKLIHEYIDETKSDVHYELSDMSDEDFGAIQIILESRQQESGADAAGQQDKKEWKSAELQVCEMCEEYMEDTECDLKQDCPAAGVIKELKEAREQIKRLEKRVKDRDANIRKLKKQVDDLRLEKSYMINPNAIGDRHEMGG